jgi:runt-related transcription factor 1
LKRFLASILQYAHDISPEVGDKVQDLVVRVVNSTIAPEDFQRQFQEATNFPLRPFVLPFLKQNLTLLVKELIQISGSGKSLGQKFLQQVQGSPRVASSLHTGKTSSVIEVDVASPEDRRNMETKERSAESLAKAMESLAPPPKKPRLVGDPPPGRDVQSPSGTGPAGGLRSLGPAGRSQTGSTGSLSNGTDVGLSLTSGKLMEPPDLGNKHADDWQHIDTV